MEVTNLLLQQVYCCKIHFSCLDSSWKLVYFGRQSTRVGEENSQVNLTEQSHIIGGTSVISTEVLGIAWL